MLPLAEVGRRSEEILAQVERAVIGKREVLELVLLGILANGHILLEDVPGLAKTLLARSFAAATSLRFQRIQFTPDLMPSDVTGSSVFDQRTTDFSFRPGPIFANLVLADEINRAPPNPGGAARIDAGRPVTAAGTTHPLEQPFVVVATQNPIEYEGTYPLPEAQLDRFIPADRDRVPVPGRRVRTPHAPPRAARHENVVDPVVDDRRPRRDAGRGRASPRGPTCGVYMVDLVAATRASAASWSARAPVAPSHCSSSRPAGRPWTGTTTSPPTTSSGRSPALAHRVTLHPELWVQRVRGEDVVREALDSVPTPPAEPEP